MAIAVDIETIEHDIKGLGPGYHRNDSAILCVGLYDGKDYVCCMPDDPRLPKWLASEEDKIFHNSIYDLGWLVHGYKWKVNGVLHDTMTRAALIDEYADLGLDACCKRFGVKGKNYDDTIEAWFSNIKKRWNLRGDVWSNLDVLWMDSSGRDALIAYNKQDCVATYDLFFAQEKHMALHKEAYQLECDLQPVMLLLNGNGFPIDTAGRDVLANDLRARLNDTLIELDQAYGITAATIRSPKQLTTAMNKLGIESPLLTETGAQSWSASALSEIDHPVIELIQNSKKYNTLLNNFLEGSMQRLTNGRMHSIFAPNKRDDGGTITGRMSSRFCNLQQIPARDTDAEGTKSYGTEMRSLFLPERNCLLCSIDYSSIEMFGLAHEAVGPKSDVMKEQARNNADFHTMAMELSGITERTWAKRLNFTILYGAGPKGIFAKNKKSFKTLEKTVEIYNKYHNGMPFVRTTVDSIANEARVRGYIKSIGGRVHHKPKPAFDPATGKWNDGLYKMANYKIQGMCADTLKRGLVDAYNAGIFNVLTLHASVHDENVVSVPLSRIGFEAAVQLQDCMEASYKDRWTVPIRTSAGVGPNWGTEIDGLWDSIRAGTVDFDIVRRYVRQ